MVDVIVLVVEVDNFVVGSFVVVAIVVEVVVVVVIVVEVVVVVVVVGGPSGQVSLQYPHLSYLPEGRRLVPHQNFVRYLLHQLTLVPKSSTYGNTHGWSLSVVQEEDCGKVVEMGVSIRGVAPAVIVAFSVSVVASVGVTDIVVFITDVVAKFVVVGVISDVVEEIVEIVEVVVI